MKKNVLIMCGGQSTERDISVTSAKYLIEQLKEVDEFNIYDLEIRRDGERVNSLGEKLELRRRGELVWLEQEKSIPIDFFIPCFHGPPGESGEIQGVYEMMGVPYLGCRPEPSLTCFNKVTTKLWLDALGICNTPWTFLETKNQISKAKDFLKTHKDIFVKASSQGSSIGCYHVKQESELTSSIESAFELSPYVLLEKTLDARELEVAVFWDGKEIRASLPGEISCPAKFYSYEEKYQAQSRTQTHAKAKDLDPKTIEEIQKMALSAFKGLKLRHLARIDFFLTENKIYLNEINTFPGMTPISLFPKMVEESGLKFKTFLKQIICSEMKK